MKWDYPPRDINPVFHGLGGIIIIIVIIIIIIIIIISNPTISKYRDKVWSLSA